MPSQKYCSARVNPMQVSSYKERVKRLSNTGGVVQAMTRAIKLILYLISVKKQLIRTND
jgi:hypothetical protein